MKRLLTFPLILMFVLMLSSCGDDAGNNTGNDSDTTQTEVNTKPVNGDVTGIITYNGVPCKPDAPDFSVPPCTGPWPNQDVKIFSSDDTSSPIMTVRTDDKGAYMASLPAGEYIIFTQDGVDPEDQAENTFNIKSGETTKLDLGINTGVQ